MKQDIANCNKMLDRLMEFSNFLAKLVNCNNMCILHIWNKKYCVLSSKSPDK